MASLLYIAHDFPTALHAIRVLACDVQAPTITNWQKLKKVARYLAGIAKQGHFFPRTRDSGDVTLLQVFTDSDWAGDKGSRKVVVVRYCAAGAVLCLYAAVHGQTIHAQSSGEAEFYGGVSGISSALGAKHAMEFLGISTKIEVRLDSSSARGILNRQGVGKIRHLAVKALWCQDIVRQGLITIKPVPGVKNIADIGTKALTISRLDELASMMGVMSKADAMRTGDEQSRNDDININPGVSAIEDIKMRTTSIIADKLMQHLLIRA